MDFCGFSKNRDLNAAENILQQTLKCSRYALISKPHRLKPPPLHISKLKKEKGFFF
jgi:transposase